MKVSSLSADRRQALKDILVVYGLFTLVVTIVGAASLVLLPARPGAELEPNTGNLLVNLWSRWDALWYIGIATHGYTPQNAAFFPLYPALISFLMALGFAPELAGVLIARVTFLVALAALYDVVRSEYGRDVAYRTILYLALFPTAMFFAAAYTEALFLMLTVLSFRSAFKQQWFRAALFAGLAALTRSPGILLIVPLAYEYLQQRRAARAPIGFGITNLLIIPAALGLFALYLRWKLGDPLAFVSAQSNLEWGRQFAVPIYSILLNIQLTANLSWPETFYHTGETLASVGFLILIGLGIIRRLRRSYLIFATLSLLLAIASIGHPAGASPGLYSVPRFAVTIFPAFICLALYGNRATLHTSYLALSPALLGRCTALFVNSYWVA